MIKRLAYIACLVVLALFEVFGVGSHPARLIAAWLAGVFYPVIFRPEPVRSSVCTEPVLPSPALETIQGALAESNENLEKVLAMLQQIHDGKVDSDERG